MAFEFRFATESDIESILSIEIAAMSNPWNEAAYNEALNSDHAFIIVATNEGEIAGFAVFYLTPPESELPDIVVAEKYRGQGLGKQLLQYSIEQLKQREIDTVFLEVRQSNAPARALYERTGFETIGKRKYFYSNPVEDAVCMCVHINEIHNEDI